MKFLGLGFICCKCFIYFDKYNVFKNSIESLLRYRFLGLILIELEFWVVGDRYYVFKSLVSKFDVY